MATFSSIVDDGDGDGGAAAAAADDPPSDHHQGPLLGDHGARCLVRLVERFQLDHEQLPPLMAAVLRQLQKARVEMEPGAPDSTV